MYSVSESKSDVSVTVWSWNPGDGGLYCPVPPNISAYFEIFIRFEFSIYTKITIDASNIDDFNFKIWLHLFFYKK